MKRMKYLVSFQIKENMQKREGGVGKCRWDRDMSCSSKVKIGIGSKFIAESGGAMGGRDRGFMQEQTDSAYFALTCTLVNVGCWIS